MTKDNFVTDSNPTKTSTYRVRFTRAKSTVVQEGTAKWNKTRKTWEDIHGPRGYINASWDQRDSRYASPKVVAWATP